MTKSILGYKEAYYLFWGVGPSFTLTILRKTDREPCQALAPDKTVLYYVLFKD